MRQNDYAVITFAFIFGTYSWRCACEIDRLTSKAPYRNDGPWAVSVLDMLLSKLHCLLDLHRIGLADCSTFIRRTLHPQVCIATYHLCGDRLNEHTMFSLALSMCTMSNDSTDCHCTVLSCKQSRQTWQGATKPVQESLCKHSSCI